MAKRKRDIQLKFRVTPQEREMIETKMAQFGTTNMAAYLRKMAIDGYVVKLDLPELRELVSLLRYSSNNLNQLTRRAHETGRIYEADLEDIQVRTVLVKDDVASGPSAEAGRRRGVAGMVFAFKVGGARADQGADIDEVVRVTEKALANTRTMGVALSPCIVPRAGKPTFTLGEDEMEIGMGIHGEPGKQR